MTRDAARAVLLAALSLATPAGAAVLGGHADPSAVEEPVLDRRAALEDMWRRRLISPDQGTFSPDDMSLLERMRRTDAEAVEFLRRRRGGYKPWTVTLREGGKVRILLTKEGFERYRAVLTQDAIKYFERRGADAKWVLKFTDWDGRRLFDPQGRITEAGEAVYRRARLNLEAYWKAPSGEAYGTRKPPAPDQPGPFKK